jgi:hypothetical protein
MRTRSVLGILLVVSILIPSSARAQEARGTIQGRVVDATYNALNLGNPNTTVTSTALGTITAQNGLPRQLQIAVKVSF